MSVFISYNHNDAEFAERLGNELVKRNIKVWKDKWRIKVGDSLIQKLQDGIEGATYLCVVFSKNTANSEWVKTEITAGLLREIEENRVRLLPVLLEDCKIPLFIRGKFFADFRGSFDHGLTQLLNVVGRTYEVGVSGSITPDDHYFLHYAIAKRKRRGRYSFSVRAVSFDTEETYSVLSLIDIVGSKLATNVGLEVNDQKEALDLVLGACALEFERSEARVKLHANETHYGKFFIHDEDGATLFTVKTEIGILGDFAGNVVLFNFGAVVSQVHRRRVATD